MAKSVADLQIALNLKGVKAVEELKSQLRALGGVANVSSQDLGKIAAAVKRYSVKGGESIGVIKGQVTALKGLQQQVAINSSAFQRLGKDIATYESKLRSAEQAAETSQAAIRRRGSFVKAAPGRFLEREAFLRSKPSEEAFGEQGELRPEFVAQQGQLNVLAEARIRLENRVEAQIRAVTKAQVDNNKKTRTAAEIVATYGGELNELPRTANNVQMELRELKSDFQNLTVGGKDYIATLRRINQLQGQLDDPFGTAARKQQIRSGLGQQQTFGMFQGRDPVQKSIERNRRKRAQQYGGFAGGGLANQPVQASGLFQQIASISQAGPKAELEMMGKSYQQVANSIKTATLASNGSINSLQAQRASWASLRDGLDPASLSYRKVGKEIDAVDRRLEKLNRKRGFSAKGAAQSLGAVAAGGIFGGPEGAIGGAIGAIGGPAGAAAGAAIGAQAGIMRQSLGSTADYAAGLQKLEIALQGVAGSGYTDALKAAGKVTKELNVPQEVAIKGITRLSAAVIGAGGSVADAEVVFKNVTSAIKATGGGADDVQSAITAMVQVFSKGKVSAEELSGQLGERLPGAVTKFAEANFEGDMIALQKALKDGTVGLNELMKFILELGDEYSDTAKKIADSSADAGARSQVAFNEIKIAVGEALQPVGAELQLAFAKFVTDILPLLKAGAIAAANAIKFLLDASAFLVKNFKELSIIAGAAGLVLVLQNLIGIAGALGTAYAKLTGVVKALNVVMLLNPWVALAAGFAAAAVAINRAVTANSRFNKSVMEGKTPRKEAEDKLRGLNEKVKELSGRLEKEGNGRMIRQLKNQLKAAKIAADDLSLAMELATSYEVSGITYDRMTGLPISGHEDKPKLTEFPTLTNNNNTNNNTNNTQDRIDRADEIVRRLQDQLAIAKQQTEVGRFLATQAKERSDLQAEFVALQKDGEDAAITEAQNAARQLLNDKQKEELNKRVNKLYKEASQSLKDTVQSLKNKITADKEYARLVAEGVNPELAKELIKINELFEAGDRKLKQRILDLDAQKKTTELSDKELQNINDQIEAIEKKRKVLAGDKVDAEGAAGEAHADETFLEGLDKHIGEIEKNLKKLIDPLNQVKAAGEAIGAAFQNSFKGLINGSMTAKEAMASFLQSVADHFADMAAQIAAEALKLAAMKFVKMILGSIAGAGGGGGGGGGTTPPATMPDGIQFIAAEGAYVPGGFKAYNKGGVVSQPTLGLVGEGGESEYIIPASKMTQAMSRYSRGARGGAVIPEGPGGDVGGEMGGGGGSIDVSYSVERINNINYVTAAEFEKGMAQAAKRGAEMGKRGVYSDLVNKRSIRSRVGI